jgi:hypothetical protein
MANCYKISEMVLKLTQLLSAALKFLSSLVKMAIFEEHHERILDYETIEMRLNRLFVKMGDLFEVYEDKPTSDMTESYDSNIPRLKNIHLNLQVRQKLQLSS